MAQNDNTCQISPVHIIVNWEQKNNHDERDGTLKRPCLVQFDNKIAWIASFTQETPLLCSFPWYFSIHVYIQFCIWKSINRETKDILLLLFSKKMPWRILQLSICTYTCIIELTVKPGWSTYMAVCKSGGCVQEWWLHVTVLPSGG